MFKKFLVFFSFFILFSGFHFLFSADYVYHRDLDIHPLNFTLNIFTLDNHKNIIGSTNRGGNILCKVIDNGNSLKTIHTFPVTIMGIHVMKNDYILVSTDVDHWNPDTPCKIYLSRDNGETFSHIKTLPQSCAVWWSIASDAVNNIYIGEYGPKGINQSKRVWKSPDFGETWKVVFTAPNVEGVHIHLVAVDPFTQHLWVSHGDDRDGIYVSPDAGGTWKLIHKSQPTSILFTGDKVYFGEDMLYIGAVSIYDKKEGNYISKILNVKRFGNYAGPVYDMTIGANNILYVPFVKYDFLKHKPSLWIGDGKEWNLVMEGPDTGDQSGGFVNIAGPDRAGYIYTQNYKIRDFTSLPLKNPILQVPENRLRVNAADIKMAWSKIKNVDQYRLVVAEDRGFKKKVLEIDVKDTSFTASLPANKRFSWRVKSLKKHMLTSSWSATYSFVTLRPRRNHWPIIILLIAALIALTSLLIWRIRKKRPPTFDS